VNPLKYHPAQIAKAIVAALSCTVILAGLAANLSATGPLHMVGSWAIGAGAVLTPVLVFMQKAETVLEKIDPGA
jgi:predicted cation transporter